VELLGISPEARDLLLKNEYSGNVRELENIIEHAVVIARGSMISSRDLPFAGNQIRQNKNEVKTFRTLRDMVLILTGSLY
jgi:transcriptional regulator with PAS, ATPase and Fis domain